VSRCSIPGKYILFLCFVTFTFWGTLCTPNLRPYMLTVSFPLGSRAFESIQPVLALSNVTNLAVSFSRYRHHSGRLVLAVSTRYLARTQDFKISRFSA